MTTSAPAVKAALKALLDTLYSSSTALLVTYGLPDGNNQPDDMVGVLDQRLGIERPTMGTARSREETVQTLVMISCFRAGSGSDVQQTATERAWALYDLLAEHFRTSPNETLSSSCREAWASAGELVEGKIEQGGVVIGRTADVTVTITSHARI